MLGCPVVAAVLAGLEPCQIQGECFADVSSTAGAWAVLLPSKCGPLTTRLRPVVLGLMATTPLLDAPRCLSSAEMKC
jgi:hypothetical protein